MPKTDAIDRIVESPSCVSCNNDRYKLGFSETNMPKQVGYILYVNGHNMGAILKDKVTKEITFSTDLTLTIQEVAEVLKKMELLKAGE